MSKRATKRARGGSSAGKYSQEAFDRGQLRSPPQGDFGGYGGLSRPHAHPTVANNQSQTHDQVKQQELSPSFAPPGKMLLPPLPKAQGGFSSCSKAEKNRTSHACDKCRKAKAKCSGGQPCDKCRNEGKECFYGDGKRDKERK
jgi:hypothetical protein